MAQQGWERQYLAALLTSKSQTVQDFETVNFFASVSTGTPNGIQELLLHRIIPQLRSIPDALQLLAVVRQTGWASYAPRILAKIADTDAVIQDHPELADYFQTLRESTGYTTYSIKDWRLLTDGTNVRFSGAPVWAGKTAPIAEVLPVSDPRKLNIDGLSSVLQYFFDQEIRLFQLAIMTFLPDEHDWATELQRMLYVPYLEMDAGPKPSANEQIENTPAPLWAPHWQIRMASEQPDHWRIHEAHTVQEVVGLGTTPVFDQLSALLSLSGLLREGIGLSPIDFGMVQAQMPSHPIWGFRNKEFSVARTAFQADDIRALALGWLEQLADSRRVTEFRSRLALHLVSHSWSRRKSASAVTSEHGFYQHVIRIAQLFDQNRFSDVKTAIHDCSFSTEAIFQHFYREADAALRLFTVLDSLPDGHAAQSVPKPDEILCVTHASVPAQTGGYAIRAHGILRSLRDHGVEISAVTRPGFPAGPLTEASTVVVDDVDYRRLPSTGVSRSHGEIQYMMSFIEPFKKLFVEQGIGTVHTRSTFLIALPALIAARQLGLKVLYEVSGLWELVYQDREQSSHLLKRSPFAELAETITMTRADQVVVMNEAVCQIALDRGVDAERIHIAHNAVDVENFTPMQPAKNKTFTIGYLGSFADYEGLDDIVDVVHELVAQEVAVQALLVGDGLRFNHVRSRIINEGLDKYFTLTGRVPHEEVMTQYQRMDVLVYPRLSSGATETITPLKPFEALALAKPIIVSDVQPLREIVGDNDRGLMFESGNVGDFACTIQYFMDNPELMASCGNAGRDWVVEKRNWGNVVQTFVQAYKRLA